MLLAVRNTLYLVFTLSRVRVCTTATRCTRGHGARRGPVQLLDRAVHQWHVMHVLRRHMPLPGTVYTTPRALSGATQRKLVPSPIMSANTVPPPSRALTMPCACRHIIMESQALVTRSVRALKSCRRASLGAGLFLFLSIAKHYIGQVLELDVFVIALFCSSENGIYPPVKKQY